MDILREVIKASIENNRLEQRPCPILIIADSGVGKTTAFRQFENAPGVFYYSGSLTPNKLYTDFDKLFEDGNVRTFILDDLGKISEQKGTLERVFGYLCNLCDGWQTFAQHETMNTGKRVYTVPLLSCTPQWFTRNKVQTAINYGLRDRVLPFYFRPSDKSKKSVLDVCRYDSDLVELPQIEINKWTEDEIGDLCIDDIDWNMLKENFTSPRQLKIARRLWEFGSQDFIKHTKTTHEIDLDVINPIL